MWKSDKENSGAGEIFPADNVRTPHRKFPRGIARADERKRQEDYSEH
jgi:hypothetical protein